MDDLIEFVLELILEGTIEISSNKKVSKWIRYPLIILLTILFSIVIIGIFMLGVSIYKENILLSLILIGVSIFMLITIIIKFQKQHLHKFENKDLIK